MVCAHLKGVNEVLDKQIDSIFDKSGINALTTEEKEQFLNEGFESLLKTAKWSLPCIISQ